METRREPRSPPGAIGIVDLWIDSASSCLMQKSLSLVTVKVFRKKIESRRSPSIILKIGGVRPPRRLFLLSPQSLAHKNPKSDLVLACTLFC